MNPISNRRNTSRGRAFVRGLSGYLFVLAALLLTLVAPCAHAQSCSTTNPIVPYIEVSGAWITPSSSAATVSSTTTSVSLGPWPASGGTWSWTGPNGFTASTREIDNITLASGANTYTATYTISGCTYTQAFVITVSGAGANPIVPYIAENGAWITTPENAATVASGTKVSLGPWPQSGGTWSWTGPNGFTASTREIDNITLATGANVYTATYTVGGTSYTETFTITVGTTTNPIVPYIEVNGTWITPSSSAATVSSTTTPVSLGPWPQSGGTWAWTGPNSFTASTREIDNIALSAGVNTYTATYTLNGTSYTQAFTITVGTGGCGTTNPIVPYIEVSGTWITPSSSAATVSSTTTPVSLGPWPQSGGTWSWTGPNSFTASTREIDNIALSAGANTYTATYTISGCTYTQAFVITVATAQTYTLTVNSINPSSGVAISVGNSLNNVISTGTTSFTETGPAGETFTLTAPATASGNAFSSWAGCTSASGQTCTATLNSNTTATANYTPAVSPGSFTLSSPLSSLDVLAGSTTTDTVTVVPVNGFTGSATLTVSGLPSGVTGTWSANPASGPSILTLTAGSAAALGTTSFSVTATYGTLSQSINFSLTVGGASTSNFTLSASSTTLNAQQNSGISDTIAVNDHNGFSGSVSFGISGLPTGVSPNFNPSLTSGSSLLTLAIAASVTPGSYPLTVVGSSSGWSASLPLTLNVSAGSSVKIAWVSPTSGVVGDTVTILPGGNGTSFGATQGSSAIYFGSTAATVTSWAVNSIQVAVPNLAAGTVNVTAVVDGITSNAVPFVIAATTPSPLVHYSNATYFGGGTPSEGACGVPSGIQDTLNYVAINVQNDPGNYTLELSRPISATGPYASDIGLWNNGLNCGRWLHVQIGKACQGENDGSQDETFCRGGAGWVDDGFEGAELDMIVHDSCQDQNAWCRDDPYHLDLFQNSIDNFVLNGAAVGDLLANWSNRQLIWYFEESPNYTGDIDIYAQNGAGPYNTQLILTHLLNGLHGVDYYSNGAWHTGSMQSDNGSTYNILPTTTAGNQYQIRVYDVNNQLINNGRIYSFPLPSSCGTTCGAITQVTYTTSSAN